MNLEFKHYYFLRNFAKLLKIKSLFTRENNKVRYLKFYIIFNITNFDKTF